MNLKYAKVYNDGSHFIAIAHTEKPKKPRKKLTEKEYVLDDKGNVLKESLEPVTITTKKGYVLTQVEWNDETQNYEPVLQKVKPKGKTVTKKSLFKELYLSTTTLKKSKRIEVIIEGIKNLFNTYKEAENYVKENIEREHRNYIVRVQRMNRIASITPFNYFVTFTYYSEKINEQEFSVKLFQTLQNLHSKKGWLYMIVKEYGENSDRLHYHGLFYIPPNNMVGELREQKDYNINKHKMVVTHVNSYFEKKFGRNDFDEIPNDYFKEINLKYIKKYLLKNNERVIYSRGLAPMRKLDILDEDVICQLYEDNPTKYLIADNFLVVNDGTVEGTANLSLLLEMPKAK